VLGAGLQLAAFSIEPDSETTKIGQRPDPEDCFVESRSGDSLPWRSGRWAVDRDGRRTYMISRGDRPRPTVLIHGGLSHAGDWLPSRYAAPTKVGITLLVTERTSASSSTWLA
jgi:hypothetical protein